MGIYFNPPAPTQAAPHTPIAAQPAAPPNRAASLLPILGAIAIAWIPPPAQPTQLAQRYIPPPVTYVASPSLIAFLANQTPQQVWGTQYQRKIPIPLQPSNPPRFQPQQVSLKWPQPDWLSQTFADNAAWNNVAAFLPFVQPQLAFTWPQPIWNTQTLAVVAPQSAVLNPPGSMAVPDIAPFGYYDSWPAQTFADNAGWNQVSTFTPFARQQVSLQWPQPTWGSQTLPATRILAQAPGNLVMPSAPQALSWPQPAWAAQTFADNAAWSTIAAFLPLAPSQVSVNAWAPISWGAQRGPAGVTLLPPHADQPPRYSISGTMALRLQWPELIWGASHFVSAADIPPGAQGTGKNQFLSGNIAFNLISGLITGSFRSGNN